MTALRTSKASGRLPRQLGHHLENLKRIGFSLLWKRESYFFALVSFFYIAIRYLNDVFSLPINTVGFLYAPIFSTVAPFFQR